MHNKHRTPPPNQLSVLQKATSPPPDLNILNAYLTIFSSTTEPTPSLQTYTTVNMGALDVLTRKSGVIVGDDVLKLFN